jgi:thiamine kinase-like enzyme
MKSNQIKRYFKEKDPLDFKDEGIVNVKRLGTGESNLNFLVETKKDRYLMRFDITNKSIKAFRQEFEILRKLESLNIAQKPLYIDASKRFFNEKFMILSYIDGASLDKLDKKVYFKDIGKLAGKIARLHKLKVNFVNNEHSFEKHIKRIERTIKGLKQNLKENKNLCKLFDIYHERLKDELKKYEPQLTFCHGDICLPNTLVNKNEFFLIDWELSGRMDPALELSYHLYEFGYTHVERKKFLGTYLKTRKDPSLLKRMKFTDFFVAFTTYFDILHTCFNIANKRGHKDYLGSADLKEYWAWGNYYLGVVLGLGYFDKDFERDLKKEIERIWRDLR